MIIQIKIVLILDLQLSLCCLHPIFFMLRFNFFQRIYLDSAFRFHYFLCFNTNNSLFAAVPNFFYAFLPSNFDMFLLDQFFSNHYWVVIIFTMPLPSFISPQIYRERNSYM